MSSISQTDAAAPAQNWRIAPSIPVAIGVFVAYVIAFIGLSATSGIAYDQWFATGGNAFRSAVLPLIAGSLVLILFAWWARWDFVFRDPVKLGMSAILWIPVVLFGLGIIGHLIGVHWAAVPTDLLLAIVAAGVLVGFAEETLFRGIILRSLRTDNRAEAWVVLISSLWFGFFHLTNVLNGSPLGGVIVQCLMASMVGATLYLFRRFSGLLVVGMIAHGLWDMSTFLPATESGVVTNFGIQAAVVLFGLIALIVIVVRDRGIAVTPTGVVALPAA